MKVESLLDRVKFPNNSRPYKINWAIAEGEEDSFRPQYVFAKNKNEAVKKLHKINENGQFGNLSLESLKQISWKDLNI